MKHLVILLAVSALGGALAHEAAADPLTREPYHFPARSGAIAAQLQMLKKSQSSSASSGGGGTSVTQYVTNYTTNSTAIGNLTEITQILDNGAQGWIDQNGTQDSSGSTQGSSANTGFGQGSSSASVQ